MKTAYFIWAGVIAAIIVLLLPSPLGRSQERVGTAAIVADFAVVIFVVNPKEGANSTGEPLLLVGEKLYAVKIAAGVSTVLGIMTCDHVVASRKEDGFLFIYIGITNEVLRAIVTKREPDFDLAIIEPDEVDYKNFPKARIAKILPRDGEEISFFGCPNRQLIYLRFQRMQRILAYAGADNEGKLRIVRQPFIPLYPGHFGDSGGGVFNQHGELIGIIQKKDNQMPVVYALPITEKFLRDIGWL